MQIRIGYLGSPHTLKEKFHTMTLKKYQSLDNKDELDKIIIENLKFLDKTIDYNIQNKIYFYRMTHNLFPLATVKDIDYDYSKFKNICLEIGEKIEKNNMRIDAHPDHFCVLSTKNEEVLDNSIRIIKNHKDIFDLLNIDSRIILHIGSKDPTKEEALKRFKDNFLNLDEDLKKIILLENDDHIYTVSETLNLCEELGIPMVLDYHHFKCFHEKNEKIERLLPRIIKTWENTNLNPKFHFSSPQSLKEKRTHNFYIDYDSFVKFLNIITKFEIDFDIMLEAKGKDEALFKILRQLKFYKPYKMKGNMIIFD